MMDEMRISTKFMQGIITKIIRKMVNKKLGVDPEVLFNSPIELKFDGDSASLHVDFTATISKNDISKILKDL